ncbi:DUF2959 domain-containing protein [Pseudocolwellia sp. AS88]|uniref:DUF2959 domain-containing protein n=1 Tax=Pseudocolwellia TaxID=2848177 RepID=UPI0026EA6080|nr:DUF2959 domain-containing protein [Pseudocolwellia sp. AS88]MDO7086295.1 DUF2959 domain-containing protein [Pseudocolwellia sp. AS88]
MKTLYKNIALVFVLISLSACQSAYYSAMEKVGVHKRDIMLDRVEGAQTAQEEAQEQFKSALEQLSSLIEFEGGDLAEQYEITEEQYEASKAAADQVTGKIESIESVSEALFEEWQTEIEQYSSASLKRQSQSKLNSTQRQYNTLIKSMYKAKSKMDPVLATLKDNTLYLKHNLNARAIGALQGEYKTLQKDVAVLVDEMSKSISQSQKFIDLLQEN